MHRLCLGAHRPKALHPSARGMIQPPPDQACVSSSPTIVSPASANIELLTEQLGLVDRVWRPEHAGTPAAMGVLDRSFPSRSPAFPTKLHMPACLPACRDSTPPCHDRRPNDTADTYRHSRLALRHTSTAGHLSNSTRCRGIETWHQVPSRPALDHC